MPHALARAKLVESLALRYHKLPHEIYAADVGLLRHVALVELGREEGELSGGW